MSTPVAALSYVAITLAMTWPLAPGIARDVPADLGDSLLNMWILGWSAEGVVGLATGALSWDAFWNANIFHPEPLALGLSEHLLPQAIQILPVYWISGNLILAYNVLFLSTFVLSGLGMYLLVRDLTGHRGAAFVAGLIFAFFPARASQFPHLQVLSLQWMPFVLLGFRRFVISGRATPLAWGSAALLAQNLSCGYYLLYFAPLVPLFVLHQMAAHGRLLDRRRWTGLVAAAVLVAAATLPFLLKYREVQEVHALERPFGEVVQFSADVYGYLTAPETSRLWGAVLQAYPKPEGELLLGFTALLLMGSGLFSGFACSGPITQNLKIGPTPFRLVLLGIITIQLAGFIAIVFTGGFVTSIAGLPVRATNASRILAGIGLALVALLVISPRDRDRAARFALSPSGIALLLFVLCLVLSLGPLPQTAGRRLPGVALYGYLYEHVPGFTGLRVPARFAQVAALFLAVLAGIGLAAIASRTRRSAAICVAAGALVLLESATVPLQMNDSWSTGPVAPPARVYAAASAPTVYRFLSTLRDDAAIAHLPFGDPAWELRFVYYASVHGRRIMNGYSGAFPAGYLARAARLQRTAASPDEAWRVLDEAGATHVVVHADAYPSLEAAGAAGEWLTAHGGRVIGIFDEAAVFELPRYTSAHAP